MEYIYIFGGLILAGLVAAIVHKRKQRRKQLRAFKKKWGKAFKQDLPFEKITIYHNLAGGEDPHSLDPAQIRDLNLREIFTCTEYILLSVMNPV